MWTTACENNTTTSVMFTVFLLVASLRTAWLRAKGRTISKRIDVPWPARSGEAGLKQLAPSQVLLVKGTQTRAAPVMPPTSWAITHPTERLNFIGPATRKLRQAVGFMWQPLTELRAQAMMTMV